MHVIEDRKPRHQRPQQPPRTGLLRIDADTPLLEGQPIDPHGQRAADVDDWVEPLPEKVALSAVPALARDRESAQRSYASKESCLAVRLYFKITVVLAAQSGHAEYLQDRGKACNLAVSEFVTDD